MPEQITLGFGTRRIIAGQEVDRQLLAQTSGISMVDIPIAFQMKDLRTSMGATRRGPLALLPTQIPAEVAILSEDHQRATCRIGVEVHHLEGRLPLVAGKEVLERL